MSLIKSKLCVCMVLLLAVSSSLQGQFLKTSGKKIINDSNQEVILRGLGIGGWMLQEGYMLETQNFANTQTAIRARIQNLIGPANTDQFYSAWLANFCTRKDIDSLARWGFNSIRLPMHYNLFTLSIQNEPTPGTNTWLDKGFAMTDSLVKWCSANKIYLILDLHAAPGGQGHDAAISDYDPSKPSLWESNDNKNKTIALWKKLAERYANEPWVGGYDLINEPNWNFTSGANPNGCGENNNSAIWQLYKDITAAIRTVDTKHIVFVEGNCWANNFTGFYAWDNNQALSYHKYWSNNDLASIQGSINMRNQFNVPVWLGESGENSNQWFKDAIQLLESNDIGWAWWPLKKIKSIVGPLTVKEDPDYRTLLDYWQNGGTAPTSDFATNALMKTAGNLKLENNVFHKDVIDAMFRQVKTTAAVPFSKNKIPGKIFFTDFDLGGNNYAYFDKDVADYHVSSGTYTAWNKGNSYRNDGVDIEATPNPTPQSNGYNIGWTEDGEWMQYTSQVDSLSGYDLSISYAAPVVGTKIRITVNDQTVVPATSLPSTSGTHNWGTFIIKDVILPKGKQKVKAIIDKGGMNLDNLSFSIGKLSKDIPLKVLDGQTGFNSQTITLNFNKALNAATITSDSLVCKVNRVPATIKNLSAGGDDGLQISFDLNQTITDADTITVSYLGAKIKSTDGSQLAVFNNLVIKNNLPLHLPIPGTIQAEDFSVNYGLASEACADTGGGLDMGYTNSGDYLEYNIRVNTSGSYTIEVRCASNSSGGAIDVQQLDDAGTLLNSAIVNVPATGGWQNWTSVVSKINLTAGPSRLRIRVTQPEFNLNWYKFSKDLVSATEPTSEFGLYPNPTKKEVHLRLPNEMQSQHKELTIYDTRGQVVSSPTVESDYQKEISIPLDGLSAGLYALALQCQKRIWCFKLIVE